MISLFLHLINKNYALYCLLNFSYLKMSIQKWISVLCVCMEIHTPLFTCPWKLEKWSLGNLLSFYCVLFDREYVWKEFYMCHIFKITNCHHPLGSFVKSFFVANRDNPGNLRNEQWEGSFPAFGFWQLTCHLRPAFP